MSEKGAAKKFFHEIDLRLPSRLVGEIDLTCPQDGCHERMTAVTDGKRFICGGCGTIYQIRVRLVAKVPGAGFKKSVAKGE
jgi:hypothetical protein